MKEKTIQWVQLVVVAGCMLLGSFSALSWATENSLIDAASAGDLARVKSLIAAGADENVKSKDGTTPLKAASKGGVTPR